jgi:sulfite reductase (NADPH) flavoprotein alpha-component
VPPFQIGEALQGGAVGEVIASNDPSFKAGDLVQIAAPAEPQRPREYSIASLPQDGSLHLLVRLHRHADGHAGLASGWLTEQAAIGEPLALRIRTHRRFRLEDNQARPLILIGNGSGLAGLRAHLKARVLAGVRQNWLLFGERSAAHDLHYGDNIRAWQSDGTLAKTDLVFSRDGGQQKYVQQLVAEQGGEIAAWVGRGASIMVCGGLMMAAGVQDALAQILGEEKIDQMTEAGLYRRDIY